MKSFGLGATGLALICAVIPSSALAGYSYNRFDNRRETYQAFRLIPEASYLSTTSNYDYTGTKSLVPNLVSYNRVQTDVIGEYGFTQRLSAFFKLDWQRTAFNQATLTASGYGLGDQEAGVNFRVWESATEKTVSGVTKRKMGLDLQAQIDFPLYNNTSSRTTMTPAMGDGSKDATLGAFFTLPLNQGKGPRWTLIPGAGYVYRTDGFSSMATWNITLSFSPETTGFYFKGSWIGAKSLLTEVSTLVTSTATVSDAGGSFITDTLNSSYQSARGVVGYQITPQTAVYASATATLTGQSVADVMVIAAGLQFRWADTGHRSSIENSYGKSNKGFVNYSLEARVLRANDRMNLIRIDKGTQDGVEVGQLYDIFSIAKDGSPSEAVGRAECTSVQASEAALTIKEYYKEVWIEEGFLAKRLVQ